ncbi:MAG: inosine/xanthosine triphosphatase [Bellilinea sp.]
MNKPLKIIVASLNPVKIQCVRSGFVKMFPRTAFEIHGVDVPSGVSVQPFTDAETLLGAQNRAEAARGMAPQADYWFGVEGGIADDGLQMEAFAWVVALSGGRVGKARTGAFYLPPEVAALVRQGIELGKADDMVFGRSNSKQKNGAIGLLTADAIDRAGYYEHAVIMALIPFKNPTLYPAEKLK